MCHCRFPIFNCQFQSPIEQLRKIGNWQSTKYLNHLLNRSRQDVDLFFRIVESKRRACGRWNIKPLHDRLSTMMTRADSNAFLIENGSDVVWMNTINHKRKY